MSTKLANASQQDTATTSDQITAYMNAYGLDSNIEELNQALDSWANVANISAADVGELAEASQRAASAASTLGVTTDQLNAQIATIESVTREAPEQIGNGLKTLYARFSDLQMGETLDDGVNLGDVTSVLQKVGVQVLDGDGKMRGVGNIMEDLMGVWSSIDSTQKAAVAQTLAGKYQLTRFEALMNRSDLYSQYKSGSENASGTLDVMNDKYVDSLQGKLNKLQDTFEGIINSLGDSSDFYGFLDGLTEALDLMQKLVDSIGGGSAALTAFGSIATKVFSTQIARGITSLMQNHQVDSMKKMNAQTRKQKLQELGYNNIQENESTKPIMDFVNTGIQYQSNMNDSQIKAYNNALDSIVTSTQGVIDQEQKMRESVEATNIAMNKALGTSKEYLQLERDANGALQIVGSYDYETVMRKNKTTIQSVLGKQNIKDATNNVAVEASEYSKGITRALEHMNYAQTDEATAGNKVEASASMQKMVDAGKKLAQEMAGSSDIWDKSFEDYAKKVEDVRTPVQNLIVYLRELADTVNDDDQNFEAATQTLNKLQQAANEIARAGDLATAQQSNANAENRMPISGTRNATKQNFESQAAVEVQKQAVARGEDFTEGMVTQDEIQSIIQVTSAVGQLSFAWQAFQNLGSIWSNDDISLGDKVLETMMNLTMVVPQAVSALSAFKDASKAISSIENIADDLDTKSVVKQIQAAQEGMSLLGVKAAASGAGLKVASSAVSGLGKALEVLTGPVGIAIAALTAFISIISSAVSAAREANIETTQTNYDDAYTKSQVDTSAFDAAYAAYQKTGEVTDELTNSSKSLADQLDITGSSALINSDNFDKLAEKISKAKNESSKLTDQLAKQQISNLNYTDNGFGNIPSRIGWMTSNNITDTTDLSIKAPNVWNGTGTITDKIKELNKAIDDYQQLLKQDNLSDSDKDAYQRRINMYQGILGGDNYQKAQQIIEQQAKTAENKLDKNDFVGQSAKQIKKILLDNLDISNEYEALGGSATKAGKEYINNLVDALEDGKGDVQNAIESGLSSSVSTDNLKSASEDKSNMKSMLEDYQKAYEEQGGFTEDEAANIVAEHPEYLEFLQKVGDQYQLNQRAVEQWTQKTREQTAAMKEANGEAIDMTSTNKDIIAAYQDLDMDNLDLQKPLQEIQQLNDLLTNGAISNSDFLDRLNSGFDTLADKINNAVTSGQALDDVLKSDDIFNFAQIMTNELYTGLQQANKQFKSGKMNVTQYASTMSKAARQSIKMEQATSGLTDEQVEQIENTEDISKVTNKMTQSQKKAAKQIKATSNQMKKLDAASDFNNFVTDNFEQINQVFDDTGKVAADATNEMGGIKEQYAQTISGLASSMTTFYQTNSDAAKNTAASIAATGAMTQQQAYEMLMTGQGLAEAMMSNSEVASAAMQGTMSEAEGAVSNMADGISGIISDIMAMFDGIDGDVTSSVDDDGSVTKEITSTDKDSGKKDSVGTITVPKFKMHISGKDNSSGGSGKRKNSYSTGKTKMDAKGNVQEQFVNKNTGRTYWAVAETGSQASIKEHSKQLAKGLSSLFGSSTPSLKNWAPTGSGVSPSSFSGLPSSGSGSGSGGGGGNGGSGGGGNGGSGGGGDTFTPQQKDALDDEIDRYERVNTLLEAIGNDYERINKEQERLTGKKLAKNIAEQNKLLQRQIDIYKDKLEIQNGEMSELQGSLSSSYGIQFDEEGYITNYATVHQKLINDVNNLINQYNAAGSEEAQDSLSDQIDAANDKLDKFKTDYQRYDTLISSDIRDTIQQIEDLNDEIEDLRINVLKTQVEAMDNLKDIQEKLVDFDRAFNRGIELTPYEEAQDSIAKLGKYFDVATMSANEYYDTLIKDQEEAMNAAGTSDAYKKWASNRIANLKAAKDRALAGDTSVDYYGTGYFDMSMKNLTDISEQMKQFNETGTSDIFGEDSADLYDVAKTVYEQATSLISDYWSEIENLHGHITDMIDDISDRMDRRKDQYEAITDELQHQADIIELLHGEESYDDLNKVLGAQQNNYHVELSELMQQRDIWKDMLGTLEEGSEEWNTVSDKIKDATSDINDLIKDSLDNLQQQYTNTVSKITKAWTNKAVGTDLDWMNTQWELINRNADYYLDDVNKSYNIQKLQGKYLDLLDGSNDLSIQQKITNQMKEQLSYLRDKTKLSEYDVNYANAQLEILQKQIALEEAQRNKSQMKLRRDTQGNYSYVYTANDDNVRSAQSDLLEAQNNAYNLSKDQMKQTQSDSLSALQDAQSTINDIWNNANLSLEEKTARTKTIVDSLKEYLAGTSEQLSTSEKNIINDFIGMCDMLTDENKNNLQDTYDQIIQGNNDAFDQIDTRWSTSISDWLQNIDDFNTSTDDMFNQLVKNGQDYADSTKELADIAKTNFDDVSGAIENTNEKTEELAKSTTDFINKLKDMSGEVAKSEATMQDYANRILDANNNMQAFKQQADDLANQLSKKEQENADLKTTISNYEKYGQATVPTGGGSGSGGAGGGTSEEIAFGIAQNIWTYGSWANDPVRRNRIIERYGEGVANRAQQIVNEYIYSGRAAQLYNPASGAYGYDTGGYTGTWSDKTAEKKDGKLAFLHQKELVLNSTDTANILAAVEAVRNFANSVKSNAISSSLGAAISQLARTKDDGNNSIEQNVHITAEFPAANSAAEIESALMSLNDRAVQYAYKIR